VRCLRVSRSSVAKSEAGRTRVLPSSFRVGCPSDGRIRSARSRPRILKSRAVPNSAGFGTALFFPGRGPVKYVFGQSCVLFRDLRGHWFLCAIVYIKLPLLLLFLVAREKV
jgi:hypothetical protein